MNIPETSELRLYTFVNFYLSSIQQGIQSAHVVHTLFTKYHHAPRSPAGDTLFRWAEDHKTIIVLNGGINDDITNFYLFLNTLENLQYPALPYTYFCEDEKSLGGIMTAVGVVLPSEYFNVLRWSDMILRLDPETFDLEEMSDESSFYYIPSDVEQVTDRAQIIEYPLGTPDHQLITEVKKCGLAR